MILQCTQVQVQVHSYHYFSLGQQVQNLTALIGKAFQVAFTESKFPKGTELKLEPFKAGLNDEKVAQGRRWVGIITHSVTFCGEAQWHNG